MSVDRCPMFDAKYPSGGHSELDVRHGTASVRAHNLTFRLGNKAFFHAVKLPSRMCVRACFINAR